MRAGTATVSFRPRDGHWWLWRPCRRCGGVELPLRYGLPADVVTCPECETRHRRAEPAGADPAVWYDTWLGGWVVRVPCGDPPVAVLLPIEVRWYDADWARVYRLAADLAYGLEAA